ncbi:MAG: 3-isopropylmalate dehydratase large subunit [Burkholderiaceae bacterium]
MTQAGQPHPASSGSQSAKPAQTLAQKVLARASRQANVEPGEIVTCEVDLAMFHDSSGPRRLAPMLVELGATVKHPERLVLVTDHYVTGTDDESRKIVQIARDWAAETGIKNFYDQQGICHVVTPERGHLRPGMFCVGGDSHSPTGGAFGCYMFGIGSTEMLGVVVTGEIWIRVPETIRYTINGELADGITAKDIMLMLIGRFGMDGGRYQAVEYAGSAVRAMPMGERMTLSNMSAELGAQAGLIEADDTTRQFLLNAGVAPEAIDLAAGQGDDGAPVTEHSFNAADIQPQVAAPHSPANAADVTAAAGEPIDIAYIGACTGAKLVDMRLAARLLTGQKVAAGVQLLLAPASVRELATARADGTLQVLLDAGAQMLPSACGACAGYGNSIAEGARVISTTARNFKGRMGSDTAQVWLASPATVAASAITGRIADPRPMLADSKTVGTP